MKKIHALVLLGSIMVISAFTFNNSTDRTISEGYSIKFSGMEAEGVFETITGDIRFDENNLTTSNCTLNIDVNSINTGNATKNKHAKSAKWFDAENYPNIKFKSNSFTKTDIGYSVTGKMNIHGIEKEITIPFTFTDNVFRTKFSVNRLDYEVGSMKGMMKKVSNEIKLDISIPVAAI